MLLLATTDSPILTTDEVSVTKADEILNVFKKHEIKWMSKVDYLVIKGDVETIKIICDLYPFAIYVNCSQIDGFESLPTKENLDISVEEMSYEKAKSLLFKSELDENSRNVKIKTHNGEDTKNQDDAEIVELEVEVEE